jgi:hypothetical protein
MLQGRRAITSLCRQSILRIEQGLNAAKQLSHAIAFGDNGCDTKNFGEWFAEKVIKHGEDYDGRFGHADV